jgi:hypothetical protein
MHMHKIPLANSPIIFQNFLLLHKTNKYMHKVSQSLNAPTHRTFLSQPHFGRSVRVKPTLPKVGSWSPPGLPKIQNSIAGVNSPRIWVFLVSLKSSWSVDVQNDLAWAIWTSAAQVMGKRRARSSIGSLTPDH